MQEERVEGEKKKDSRSDESCVRKEHNTIFRKTHKHKSGEPDMYTAARPGTERNEGATGHLQLLSSGLCLWQNRVVIWLLRGG